MSNARLYLVNVGANASHGRVTSPLYEDGNFDLITIPEHSGEFSRSCLRYCDLPWHNPTAVHTILGERRWTANTHNDPDLWDGVYGDVPYGSPRAAALRHVRTGDAVLFFARLRRFVDESFTGKPGFHFVGGWQVDEILDSRENRAFSLERRVMDNPHVRKRLAGSKEGFTLYLARGRPTRLAPPIRIGRAYLRRVLPQSRSWEWASGRTSLQVIGSYLRTVKAVEVGGSRDLADLFGLVAR